MKGFDRPKENQEGEPSAKRSKVSKDMNRLQVEEAQRQQASEQSVKSTRMSAAEARAKLTSDPEQQRIDQQIAERMSDFDQQAKTQEKAAQKVISEYQFQKLDNIILAQTRFSDSNTRGHVRENYTLPIRILDDYRGREVSGQTQHYSRDEALDALTKVRNFLNDKDTLIGKASRRERFKNHLDDLERQYRDEVEA